LDCFSILPDSIATSGRCNTNGILLKQCCQDINKQ
jgi:hypothetical protein